MNESEHLIKTLECLLDQCRQGLLHHGVWHRMVTEAKANPRSISPPGIRTFLNVSARAHLYHAISFVNRVFDKGSGSLSLYHVLNYINSNARKINGISVDDLNAAVKEDKRKIQEVGDIITHVHIWRDKHFSHLDKENIKEMNVLTASPVQYQEIKQLLELATDILNGYKEMVAGSSEQVGSVVSRVTDEVSLFFRFLRAHSQGPT